LLVLLGTSSASAAGVWSSPENIDPAITANSVSCASSSFCAAVGMADAFGSAAVYRDGSWSEASFVDMPSQLFSVSCPTSSFCLAMDGSGNALAYNGNSWSAPTPAGVGLDSVSCTSRTFCVAVGAAFRGGGNAAVYNGSTWSSLATTGVSFLDSVSCVSESFCVAIGGPGGGAAYAVTYNGSTWSKPSEIDSESENALHSVSCGATTLCVAVGNFGDEVTYNGSAWSKPAQIGLVGYIQSVVCHSESFCMATSPGGEAVKYDGSTWSIIGHLSLDAVNGGVSCPTESFCMSIGDYATTYDGSAWNAAVPVGGGLSSVSCPSASLCTAVDYHGRAITYNGSSWSTPTEIDSEGGLASVSCPITSFCMAGGGRRHGETLTYNDGMWSASRVVDTEGPMDSISCSSPSFCIALTHHTVEGHEHGYALTYSNGVWGTPQEIAPAFGLRSVSCASEVLCVAVGDHDAAIYSHGSWGTPTQIDAEGFLYAVSCASLSFCQAVGEHATAFGASNYGEALSYNGSSWSAPVEITPAPKYGPIEAGSISCVSPSFCMAGARGGASAIFEGDAWDAWEPIEMNGDFSSVSCSSSVFCVVVSYPGQVFAYSVPSTATPTPTAGSTVSSISPPLLTSVHESARRWREGKRLAQISRRKKPPMGTTFSFALNEQATIVFTFSHRLPGRKVRSKCVAKTKKDRRRPACQRTVTVGTLSLIGHAGENKLVFQGSLSRTKKLRPGTYTLIITATNSAEMHSAAKLLRFTIVK
jgi:hypothetical protein